MATDETAPQPAPVASIRSYLDRQLDVAAIDDGYELRYVDQPLAWLGDPQFAAVVECVTRDGTWWFRRFKGGDTEATDPYEGAAAMASYKSGLLPGGTIQLSDETRFKLRPPVAGETWKLRRGPRERALEIERTKCGWKIGFGPLASEIYQLPLLTMFALHAVLVEFDRPGGGGGDGGAGAGF
jgi:hypothetical protein